MKGTRALRRRGRGASRERPPDNIEPTGCQSFDCPPLRCVARPVALSRHRQSDHPCRDGT
jgi:hypothetical protein